MRQLFESTLVTCDHKGCDVTTVIDGYPDTDNAQGWINRRRAFESSKDYCPTHAPLHEDDPHLP